MHLGRTIYNGNTGQCLDASTCYWLSRKVSGGEGGGGGKELNQTAEGQSRKSPTLSVAAPQRIRPGAAPERLSCRLEW